MDPREFFFLHLGQFRAEFKILAKIKEIEFFLFWMFFREKPVFKVGGPQPAVAGLNCRLSKGN